MTASPAFHFAKTRRPLWVRLLLWTGVGILLGSLLLGGVIAYFLLEEEDSETSWFWLRTLQRSSLVEAATAEPRLRALTVTEYFGGDTRWSINGRTVLPLFMEKGSQEAHLYALAQMLEQPHPEISFTPEEQRLSGILFFQQVLERPDYKEICSEEGISAQGYRKVAEALRDIDLSGYTLICGYDRLGHLVPCGRDEQGKPPAGIEFFPWFHMGQSWYYALGDVPPLETAPYGVIHMIDGWYRLTP